MFPLLVLVSILGTIGVMVPAQRLSHARTRRLIAKQPRLLDASRVFVTQDELAEAADIVPQSKMKSDVPVASSPFSAISSGRASRFIPVQLHAIVNLNTLPRLRKEAIWRPDCFAPHRALLGLDTFGRPKEELADAVRHWADGLL